MTAPATDLPPARAPEPRASRWEDFIDIFYAPSQVFARRRDHRFGLPLFVFVALATALFFAFRAALEPVMDAEMARAMVQRGVTLTAEQMSAARRTQAIFGAIGYPVTMAVTTLVLGFVVWLVSKFFDGKEPFAAAATIATFAMFPRLAQAVAMGVIAMMSDPARLDAMTRVVPSPAAFFDPATSSRPLLALLTRLDPFVLWSTALIAIGLTVLAAMPKSKAWATAVVVWLLGAVPALLAALR